MSVFGRYLVGLFAVAVLSVGAWIAVSAQGVGEIVLNCQDAPCDAVARGRAAFNDRRLVGLAGNGRACADCHVPSESFQLSPAVARARLEALLAKRAVNRNADDPLFRPVDADDFREHGDAANDYSNLVENGLVRVTLTLPANVRLIDPATCATPNPVACQPTHETSVDVWRAVMPVNNVAITGPDHPSGSTPDAGIPRPIRPRYHNIQTACPRPTTDGFAPCPPRLARNARLYRITLADGSFQFVDDLGPGARAPDRAACRRQRDGHDGSSSSSRARRSSTCTCARYRTGTVRYDQVIPWRARRALSVVRFGLRELVHALMRQPEEAGGVARAHLQFSGSQYLDGASSSSGCASVFFISLLAKGRVGPNRLGRGAWQLHVVHDGGLARITDEKFQRLSNAAPRLVDGATLRVAAAHTAHGGHPPA
jgi:hypothetical protein